MRNGYGDEEIEFEDEMRLGTRTELGRKWSPIGVRPSGKQKIGYEYLYLYVSLKPFTGELFTMFLPRLDKECCALFTKERSRTIDSRLLMIADGATAHRSADEKIELLKLPAYSPETNPVERFFEELRKQLEFCVFETLDEAEFYLTKVLQKYYEQPALIKSLTLYPYIKHAQLNLN